MLFFGACCSNYTSKTCFTFFYYEYFLHTFFSFFSFLSILLPSFQKAVQLVTHMYISDIICGFVIVVFIHLSRRGGDGGHGGIFVVKNFSIFQFFVYHTPLFSGFRCYEIHQKAHIKNSKLKLPHFRTLKQK